MRLPTQAGLICGKWTLKPTMTVCPLGTSGQELEQRPGKSTACWLAPCGWLGLLSHTAQAHLPRTGTTHSGLDHPA